MSIRIMTAVWSIPLPDSEKIVLLALADNANDSGACWPSIATLSEKCSKSDRTIQAAIKSLVGKGHLSREEKPGKGCMYYVHPTPEETSPPKKLHPRKDCTTPPKPLHHTPEAASDKPSINRHEPSDKQTKRARVLPDGWTPEGFASGGKCAEIISAWPDGELETQIEHFTSHHRSKGTRFVDWQDAWKTWVLNSRKWNTSDAKRSSYGKHSGVQGKAGDSRDGIARALDRRLGLDEPSGSVGRGDIQSSGGYRALPFARPNSSG